MKFRQMVLLWGVVLASVAAPWCGGVAAGFPETNAKEVRPTSTNANALGMIRPTPATDAWITAAIKAQAAGLPESVVATHLSLARAREQYLHQVAPEMVSELDRTSQDTGICYERLLVAALVVEEEPPAGEEGCTSWVIPAAAAADGLNLVHKNRDYDWSEQWVVKVPASVHYGYLGIVTASSPNSIAAGINDHGLAVANNYVAVTDVVVGGMGSLRMTRYLLERCRTVEEAYQLIADTDLSSGVIFLLGDGDKVAIVEKTKSQITAPEDIFVTDGPAWRSNHFMNLTGPGASGGTSSTRRYDAAAAFFATRPSGLHVWDCHEFSRTHYNSPTGEPHAHDSADGSVCNHNTLFGATFQIQPAHPEASVMWAALGNPCNSQYTSFHVGATDIHEAFTNGSAWHDAEAAFVNNYGPRAGNIPGYLTREAALHETHGQMVTEALLEFEGNHRAAAIAALTAFDADAAARCQSVMQSHASAGYWRDAFYTAEGINASASVNVTIDPGYATLVSTGGTYRTTGRLVTPIIAADSWVGATFRAQCIIPAGCQVSFKIVGDGGSWLIPASAGEAAAGVAIPSDAPGTLAIQVLLEGNGTTAPQLLELEIMGLPLGLNPRRGGWAIYYYSGAALIGVVVLCCCCRRRRRGQLTLAEWDEVDQVD
jgi:hypothetical protein